MMPALGVSHMQVRAFLQPPMEGVVLETYGSGNAPDNRPDLLEELKKATDAGVIIINCTQCLRGTVSTSYATGKVWTPSRDHHSPASCSIFPVWRQRATRCFSVPPQVLIDAGLIAGGDLTPEAALSKLSYVLAKKDVDLATKKKVGGPDTLISPQNLQDLLRKKEKKQCVYGCVCVSSS